MKVLINGYFGFKNLGDELILKYVSDYLKNKGFTSLYCLTQDIAYSYKIHNGIEFIHREDYDKIIDIVKIVDLVVLAGGGLFQDYDKLNVKRFFDNPKFGVHSYFNIAFIAKIYQKKIAYLFQGVGPFFSGDSESFAKFIYSYADYISVRDEISYVSLKKMEVDNVVLSVDPVLNKFQIKNYSDSRRARICLSLRQWVDKDFVDAITEKIITLLNLLDGDKFDIYFVSFQEFDDYNSDSKIYNKIKKGLTNGVRFELIDSSELNLQDFEKMFSDFDFVIGMRYHSIILSIKYGIPFMAIPYWDKVRHIVDEFSINEMTIVKETGVEFILSYINRYVYNRDEFIEKIFSKKEYMIKRIKNDEFLFEKFLSSINLPSLFESIEQKQYFIPENNFYYILKQIEIEDNMRKNTVSDIYYESIVKEIPNEKIIVYPSLIEWNSDLFQRPHQIFRKLAKLGYRILFITPNYEKDKAFPINKVQDNIYIIGNFEIVNVLKGKNIILWISWTPFFMLKNYLKESFLIYDWIDDLSVFAYYCKLMEMEHKNILKISDIVFCSSEKLYLEALLINNNSFYIPNGVEPEDFIVAKHIIPEDMIGILNQGKPIVGYYGYIAEWRIDYELINYATSKCKDVNFVFIGPVEGKFKTQSDNLFLLSPKDYRELKYYLANFDVAIIPYKVNSVTDAVFPVKLCEYMSMGKPVVSTNIKEVANFDSVLVSSSYDEFVDCIYRALKLKEDKEYLKKVIYEARKHTWELRALKIDEILRTKFININNGVQTFTDNSVEYTLVYNNVIRDLIVKYKNKERILENEIYNLLKELRAKEDSIKYYEGERIRLFEDISKLNSELKVKEDSIKYYEGERIRLFEDISKLNSELKLKEDMISNLKNAILLKEKNLKNAMMNIEKLNYQINFFKNSLENIYSSDFWKVATIYYRFRDRYFKNIYKLVKSIRQNGFYITYKKIISKIRKKKLIYIQNPLNGIDNKITTKNETFVIFFSIINFDFRIQRPQHIAKLLAKEGYKVIYISVDLIEKDVNIKLVENNIYSINLSCGLWSTIYNLDLNNYIDRIKESFSIVYDKFRINHAICFVEYPNWFDLVKLLKFDYGYKVIFDVLDDFAGFSNLNKDLVINKELSMYKISDLVITTSDGLYIKAKKYHKNVALIRNGCDFEYFNKAQKNGKLEHIKKPIIGYYGAISDWFDDDLVIDCAKRRPDWSFVLVGNTFGSNIEKKAKNVQNIHILGEIPYSELTGYYAYFDVCIIPFKICSLIEHTNPVKFYEYCAAGKPIVAPMLPEIVEHKDMFYSYTNTDEFLDSINKSLNESDLLKESRIKLAQNCTWYHRVEKLRKCINNIYPKVSIIIVTYNNLDLTKLCIKSILEKNDYPNLEIIIVDNGSQDGSDKFLKELEEKYNFIRVILNEKNLGFAAANNIGIKNAQGDYIILLNNDTIVTKGFIHNLLKHFQKDNVGLVGPVTNSIGNEAKINVTYKDIEGIDEFAWEYTSKNINNWFYIDVLAFYCIVIPKKVIEEVGLLDESFSVGMFEDDDYCLRVNNAGYKLICAEDVFIHHFGGASFKKLDDDNYRNIFEKNKAIFETKHNVRWKPHKYRDGVY